MKFLILLVLPLAACSTPSFTRVKTANMDFTHIGRGSFIEDSEVEKENDAFLFNPDGSLAEYRNRSEKYGKRQTTVPNSYLMMEGTKFLASESTKALESTNARDVDLGAQAADVSKAGMVPTVTEVGQTVTFPR